MFEQVDESNCSCFHNRQAVHNRKGGAALQSNCMQLNCLDSRDAGIILTQATFTSSQAYAALEKSPRQVAVVDHSTEAWRAYPNLALLWHWIIWMTQGGASCGT